ncbi:MAG: acyl-CoA thioesterase [Candidatus Zixiibacteriota bacterium]
MYNYQTSVKLHDTDMAGFLFFGHQFKIAHDAYEEFMEAVGLGFARLIHNAEFLLPIVHAEADYKTVLQVGDKLKVQVQAVNIGKTSFTLGYNLVGIDGESVGTVKTVHVCVDSARREKMPLPEKLRKALLSITDKSKTK